MIRNLLYLFLLEICFANGQSEYTLKLLNKKEYYVNTSKIVYYGPPGIPPLPDFILIDDVDDIKEKFIARANFDTAESFDAKGKFRATEKFILHYRNLTFYNLSSAYSLEYKIDLAAQKVEAVLTLSTAQLKGRLSVSTPTSSISTINFAVNFYTMFLSYEMSFEISNGTVLFEKTIDRLPHISMATEVPDDMKKYGTRKLLETVSARLNEEVRQHKNLDDVRFQIKREISSIYRAALGERFRKTIIKAFQSEGINANIINLFNFDIINSSISSNEYDYVSRTDTKYNLRIPSFALRFREKLYSEKNIEKISFIENEIHLRCHFDLSSPRLVATTVYRIESEVEDKTFKTLVAEYQLIDILFTFELVARLDTASINLTLSNVESRNQYNFDVKLVDDQANFQDIRDLIVKKTAEFLNYSLFIQTNCNHTLRHYINGVLADGRIAEEVFKDD